MNTLQRLKGRLSFIILRTDSLCAGGQDQDGDAPDPGEELPPRQSDIADGVNDLEEHELEELVKLLGAEIKS